MKPVSATRAIVTAAALLAFASGAALAEDHARMNHAHMQQATPADAPTAGMAMASGQVKKLNKAAGTMTIAHGPLTNLDMPGMTMVFHVKDPAMLDQVKPGDKISFHAEMVNGSLTVTRLELAN